MGSELELLAGRIIGAKHPEQVFGKLDGKDPFKLGLKIYRDLSKATHPDLHKDPLAGEAFKRLSALWSEAETKIKTGTYGVIEEEKITIKTRTKEYEITGDSFSMDFSNLYRCSFVDAGIRQKGVLKIVRDPGDNDLLQNEARILRLLKDTPGFEKHHNFFPDLVDSFVYRDQTNSTPRQANVFRRDGYQYFSLSEIRQINPNGIDPKDVAWICRRLLFATGIVGQNNFVHGAILPDNILIQPEGHGLVLNEWSYAVADPKKSEELVTALNPAFESWYPQEVFQKKIPTPALDIYMGAKNMVYLLGGDPDSGRLPMVIDPKLRRFFSGCLIPDQRQVPGDAWKLLGEFDQLIGSLWGPRKFHPFGISGIAEDSPFR